MVKRDSSNSSGTKSKQTDTEEDIDLREQFRVIGGDVKELADQVRRLASGRLKSAGAAAQDLKDDGIARVEDFGENMSDKVRAHPLRSVAIAAGAGALLACLAGWGRR